MIHNIKYVEKRGYVNVYPPEKHPALQLYLWRWRRQKLFGFVGFSADFFGNPEFFVMWSSLKKSRTLFGAVRPLPTAALLLCS